ncbi:MAG TPA: NADH-quinone oxidoreductase subunit N [bacterium]|jgi:NADH-quinone oxidoreductase subunit N|nr:NADH-quinone oxidoreductase subunit N [bacterium]
MNLQLILPEFAVLGLGLLVFFLDLLAPEGASRRYLGWVCAAGFAVILAVLLASPFPQGPSTAFGGLFIADSLARVFEVLFLSAALLASLASVDALEARGVAWAGEYYFLLVMVTLAMMCLASAGDLLSLYVALELNSLGFYALVSILKGRSLVSSEAGIKYLILGAIASALLLYGFSILYGLSGTLSLQGLAAWSQGAAHSPALLLALALVTAGLAFKVSLVPFHMWAPDVYQAAPTPITAFLSVASKAAGLALLMRVLDTSFHSLAGVWDKLLMVMMALTFVWANVVALKQRDLKRLMAYSSVAQAGYLMIGIVAGTPLGLQAVLFYALVYLFTNMAAFQVIQLVSVKGSPELSGLKGLARRSPGLALIMLCAVLSLGGIPPFGGFFGKYFLFAAGVQEGLLSGRVWLLALVAFAVVMSIVSLFYYLVIIKQMYIEPSADEAPVAAPAAARIALGLCTLMILVTGVYPSPILDWLKQALP